MSKKDYIAIANALKDTKKYINATSKNTFALDAVDKVAECLSVVFRIDNNNFDASRFFYYLESDKRYKDFTD